LNKLQQTTSVKDLTDKFLQLVVKIGKSLSKEDRMRRYVEGLKDEGRYTTFNQMKSAAEALDFELWCNRSRANTERTPNQGNAPSGQIGTQGGASSSGTNYQNHPRRFPPKVSSLQKSYSLPKEETSRQLEKNLCFRCGKSGHIARDCPGKDEMRFKDDSKK
jgi:Zinc knuckle